MSDRGRSWAAMCARVWTCVAVCGCVAEGSGDDHGDGCSSDGCGGGGGGGGGGGDDDDDDIGSDGGDGGGGGGGSYVVLCWCCCGEVAVVVVAEMVRRRWWLCACSHARVRACVLMCVRTDARARARVSLLKCWVSVLGGAGGGLAIQTCQRGWNATMYVVQTLLRSRSRLRWTISCNRDAQEAAEKG